MITHHSGRVTETPDDLVTAARAVAISLIIAAKQRRLIATVENGRPGGRAGHLWRAQAPLQRRANQLDPEDGGDRR